MPDVVVRFQIPICEDEKVGTGAKHSISRWKTLQDALEENFGGWSKFGSSEGGWKDPERGIVVHDKCRVFEVDVAEGRLDELRALLRRACLTFCQKCIRAVILGRAEYIYGGPDNEPL